MIGNACWKSEINNFNILIFIKQNIFQFNISMSYALTVTILQSDQNLLKYPSGFLFIQLLIDHLFQIGMQTSPSYIFHYKINIRISFKCLNKFNYIWMVHFLKKNYFSPNASLSIYVDELCLVIYFDGVFFAVFPWSCTSYNSICSFSNLFSKLVIMNSILTFMVSVSIFIVSNLRRVVSWVLIY